MNWEQGLYSAGQVPESVYHADDIGDVPTLSRSTAAELVNDSPADAWDHHPRLGGIRKQVTEEMEWASLVHSLILGSGPEFRVLPQRFDNYRTDAAKALRDGAREEGAIPMLEKDYGAALEVALKIVHHLEPYLGSVQDGLAEATVLWEEPQRRNCNRCGGTGISQEAADAYVCQFCEVPGEGWVPAPSIRCRARMDLWTPNHPSGPMIFDLKIVESTREAFERSMTAHGLDIQAAVYTRAMERVHPELAGRIGFAFLLCRRDGRYVVPVTPSRSALALGASRWERAALLWAKALASGEWPGPSGRVLEIKPWQHEAEARANGLYEVEVEGDGNGA